jgi:hypothetical protein
VFSKILIVNFFKAASVSILVGACATLALATPNLMRRVNDDHMLGVCLCTYEAINGRRLGELLGGCFAKLTIPETQANQSQGLPPENQASSQAYSTSEDCNTEKILSEYDRSIFVGLTTALIIFAILILWPLVRRPSPLGGNVAAWRGSTKKRAG